MLFASDARANNRIKSTSVSGSSKEIAELWGALDAAARAVFEHKSEADRTTCAQQSSRWEAELIKLEKAKSSLGKMSGSLSRDEKRAVRKAEDAEKAAAVEKKQTTQQPRKPIVVSEAAQARAKHNEAVKAAKAETAPRRAAFFRAHKEALSDFGARVPDITECGGVTYNKSSGQVMPPPEVLHSRFMESS